MYCLRLRRLVLIFVNPLYRDFSEFAFRGGLCFVRDVACRDVRIVRSNIGEDDV
ncbi:conserved hypothetical protein [Neisseria meningitidis 053442]|nr:conserved hypothetical protein [Neisseria meningitidis 053442]